MSLYRIFIFVWNAVIGVCLYRMWHFALKKDLLSTIVYGFSALFFMVYILFCTVAAKFL